MLAADGARRLRRPVRRDVVVREGAEAWPHVRDCHDEAEDERRNPRPHQGEICLNQLIGKEERLRPLARTSALSSLTSRSSRRSCTDAAPIICAYSNPSNLQVDETVISTTPDTSFRWDSTAQQWIFNPNTGNLQSGTRYTYVIPLLDGTLIFFTFAVK